MPFLLWIAAEKERPRRKGAQIAAGRGMHEIAAATPLAKPPGAHDLALDTSRLARAVHLEAERIGNGAWTVSGGAGLHHVVSADATSCDCENYRLRGGPCKHALAVRLRLGDLGTLRPLRAIVPALRGRRVSRRP